MNTERTDLLPSSSITSEFPFTRGPKFLTVVQDACSIVDEQTMKHLLVCHILPQPCTHENLEEFNPELGPAPSIGPKSCSGSRRSTTISNDKFLLGLRQRGVKRELTSC